MTAEIYFVVVVGGVESVENPATHGGARLCARENLGITLRCFPSAGAESFISLCIFIFGRKDSCLLAEAVRGKRGISTGGGAKNPHFLQEIHSIHIL